MLAARGRVAVLLATLLVWHHTYVLWHLAGSHNHLAVQASAVSRDAASHVHGSAQNSPHRSATRFAGDHAHDSTSRKRYGHFASLVHRLQHDFPELGTPQAPQETAHGSPETDAADRTGTSSHSHGKGGKGAAAHSAGDHLAGYYSGHPPVPPGVLEWHAAEALRNDQCLPIRLPYVGRAKARAPPLAA